MEEVKIFIDKDRRLFIHKKDGTKYSLTVFSGGGYYNDIWLRTDEEIEESEKKHKEYEIKEKKERERETNENKSWWRKLINLK